MSARESDDRTVIDVDEFEAAQRDPAVHRFIANAEAYAAELVALGHCPHCLVVNCEHMRADDDEGGRTTPAARERTVER